MIVEGYPSGIDTFNGNKLWKGTMSGSTEPLKIDADITGMHYANYRHFRVFEHKKQTPLIFCFRALVTNSITVIFEKHGV